MTFATANLTTGSMMQAVIIRTKAEQLSLLFQFGKQPLEDQIYISSISRALETLQGTPDGRAMCFVLTSEA